MSRLIMLVSCHRKHSLFSYRNKRSECWIANLYLAHFIWWMMIHVFSLICIPFTRYFKHNISSHSTIFEFDYKIFDAKCIHHLMHSEEKSIFSCHLFNSLYSTIIVTFIYANEISMGLIENLWKIGNFELQCAYSLHGALFKSALIMDNAHPQGANWSKSVIFSLQFDYFSFQLHAQGCVICLSKLSFEIPRKRKSISASATHEITDINIFVASINYQIRE